MQSRTALTECQIVLALNRLHAVNGKIADVDTLATAVQIAPVNPLCPIFRAALDKLVARGDVSEVRICVGKSDASAINTYSLNL